MDILSWLFGKNESKQEDDKLYKGFKIYSNGTEFIACRKNVFDDYCYLRDKKKLDCRLFATEYDSLDQVKKAIDSYCEYHNFQLVTPK